MNVKIFTTRGRNGDVISIPAGINNWNDLNTFLLSQDIDTTDMKPIAQVPGGSQDVLNSTSPIPLTDFSLFLTPIKTKSGKQ